MDNLARPRSGAFGNDRTIVVALGGNALLPPGERGEIHEQFGYTRSSLEPIVELAAQGWKIAVVHGNGPQVGDELMRNQLAIGKVPALPLGVLVAATAGWIGYMVQQSLQNALARAGIEREVVTVVTQTVIDNGDPNGDEPTKPIGRIFDEAQARRLEKELGWSVGRYGDGWRRLVASPRPASIRERETVRRLVDEGTIVIAAGGGGIPVRRSDCGALDGLDAVVDKDWAAEILAREVGAEMLLILTNVEGAYKSFGSPDQELLRRLTVGEAQRLLEAGEFARGSMGPKVAAAIDFVRGGGRCACIGRLDQGLAVVNGTAGTSVHPG